MKYLNFPQIILKDAFSDMKTALDNVFNYSLFITAQDQEGTLNQRLEKAARKMKIKYPNKEESYRIGEAIYKSIPHNSPKTGITKDMIFDFYNGDKTEFEIISFLAFAALRSILQRQAYTKITNEYLLNRMAGNLKKGEPLPEWIYKFRNRYQLDKIKKELELNWGLQLYGNHTRGYYVSFAMKLIDLIKVAEVRRKGYKEQQLKEAKEKDRKTVLNEIYSKAL